MIIIVILQIFYELIDINGVYSRRNFIFIAFEGRC